MGYIFLGVSRVTLRPIGSMLSRRRITGAAYFNRSCTLAIISVNMGILDYLTSVHTQVLPAIPELSLFHEIKESYS